MQRRDRTDETGEEIGGAGLAIFAGAAGIPNGELVDLDTGDGFDLFGDESGQLLTASYQDYCIPRASDMPHIEVTLDDSAPCKTNPLGAKGCGESGTVAGTPTLVNAVIDALSSRGVSDIDMPTVDGFAFARAER